VKDALPIRAGRALSARALAERTLYFMKTTAARYPLLALPLSRIRGEGELLGESTDILIESFPRCASSFAVAAFRQAQKPGQVRVAYQTHTPGHAIAAVRRGVPAVVLTREPEDVVVSNLIRHPERGVNGLLRGFLRFYEPLLSYRDGLVVATFDEVVEGRLGAVIRRVNDRFGTSFAEFEATPENVDRCLYDIDQEWRRRWGRSEERLERIVPRPSEMREELKDALRQEYRTAGSIRLRDRATKVYERLTG
jgi:hypothetical protein